MDDGLVILIILLVSLYSVGIISIWKNQYSNFFLRFLTGHLQLSKKDNQLVLKQVKLLYSFLYCYNVMALSAIYFLFPYIDPIIITGIAITIPLVRGYAEKIVTERYGIEKVYPDKRKSKKNLVILILLITLLIAIDNPLSMIVLGVTLYVLLAYGLQYLKNFFVKKPYDTSPENQLKNHFNDDSSL